MAYIPDWESLGDALKRLTAAGASGGEAKGDLCRAMADRKIDVRVRIAATANRGMGGRVFSDGNVGVPLHLSAGDLDWLGSRPLARWSIGPRLGEQYAWLGGWESQPLDLVELSTADVIRMRDAEKDEEKSTTTAAQEDVASRYPGRPSGRQLVLKKFRERAADGATSDTLADEARWLLKWAHQEYPGEPGLPSTEKTIQNQIRDEFRQLRWKLK